MIIIISLLLNNIIIIYNKRRIKKYIDFIYFRRTNTNKRVSLIKQKNENIKNIREWMSFINWNFIYKTI